LHRYPSLISIIVIFENGKIIPEEASFSAIKFMVLHFNANGLFLVILSSWQLAKIQKQIKKDSNKAIFIS
jgi:hypothetical protein